MPRHDDWEQRCVFLASGGCVTCRQRPTSTRKVCCNCKEDVEKEEKGFDTAYWLECQCNKGQLLHRYSLKAPNNNSVFRTEESGGTTHANSPMLSQAFTLTLASRLLPVPSSNTGTLTTDFTTARRAHHPTNCLVTNL
jgi:hypothetical protein